MHLSEMSVLVSIIRPGKMYIYVLKITILLRIKTRTLIREGSCIAVIRLKFDMSVIYR